MREKGHEGDKRKPDSLRREMRVCRQESQPLFRRQKLACEVTNDIKHIAVKYKPKMMFGFLKMHFFPVSVKTLIFLNKIK